jgi:saccharopine dehydrogenase-like NADP-dependent oxidoreductase
MERTRILVMGAGRVGAAMALDLAEEPAFDVTVADRAGDALEALAGRGLDTREVELGDPGVLEETAVAHDLVVGAVPGDLGYETVRRLVDAGRDVVDISFFPEDPYGLHDAARERDVRVLVDCGVAPGLSNLILGHLETALDRVESFTCLVGGLPAVPSGPWGYRAPFSPGDVIEEYVRPARLRRDGREVVLPALSEVESVELPGVGPLEAFLTDGLRTLLTTTDTPTLIEKTLRHPGHADRVRALRDSGFFDREPLEVDGTRVAPLDLTRRLLGRAWRPEPDEEELTVMRVRIVGESDGRATVHVFDLLDRTDPETGTSSMARTTGYTCTALVRWLAEGGWERPGVAPPEVVARDAGCFDFVRAHLARRGVRLTHREERP